MDGEAGKGQNPKSSLATTTTMTHRLKYTREGRLLRDS